MMMLITKKIERCTQTGTCQIEDGRMKTWEEGKKSLLFLHVMPPSLLSLILPLSLTPTLSTLLCQPSTSVIQYFGTSAKRMWNALRLQKVLSSPVRHVLRSIERRGLSPCLLMLQRGMNMSVPPFYLHNITRKSRMVGGQRIDFLFPKENQ